MENPILVALPFIGLTGGFVAGLLGLGGGVILLPLLTFIGRVPLQLATGTSLVHVFIAAATGVFSHYREGMVDIKAGLILGAAGVVGGLVGSFLSASISTRTLQIIYLSVVMLAVIILFIPQKLEEEKYKKGEFNKALGILMAFGVGSLTGLLGVGGAFIMIPLMIYVLKIPMRVTIGTSLQFILITSLGTLWAKFGVGHIHLSITPLVVSGSVIGAWLGASVSRRTPVKLLHLALLALLVLILFSVGYETFFSRS